MSRRRAILSDQPADRDLLNFDPYVQTLVDIVTDPETDTPLAIGVFGDWGRGKTSLMRMVQRLLIDRSPEEQDDFALLPVWFNAWLYSREETLWRALIARVLQEVQGLPGLDAAASASLRRLETRLYAPQRGESGELSLPDGAVPGLGAASLPTLTGLELLRRQAERGGNDQEATQLAQVIADVEASQALTRRDQIVALDDFRRQFEVISRAHIEDRGRLVIFVDDLDRCLPESAVEVLEAIKLFLDVPGMLFVLGIDQRVLEEGIRVRYGQRYGGQLEALDGARYLEKIIQIPLNLPDLQPAAIGQYVQQVTTGVTPDERCQRVFAVGLEPNPRRIKRTLNVFLLLWRLAQHLPDLSQVIRPVRLAKIVVIQQHHRDLFDLLVRGPHYLPDLERRFRDMGRAPAAEARRGAEAAATPEGTGTGTGDGTSITAGPLQPFLGRTLLRDLLTCTAEDEPDANFVDLRPAQVAEYLFLSRSAEQEEETLTSAPASAQKAARPRMKGLDQSASSAQPQVVEAIEPQMVTVTAGPFLMGSTEEEIARVLAENPDAKREWLERELPQHTVDLPTYQIGRYPVTNAEFARFLADGGYENQAFWTTTGWNWRKKENRTQPEYWENTSYNEPAQPVVGLSWYEAMAYCRWLSQKIGKAYRLPTEREWEKAARGTDGRRYPWEEDPPTPERCNFGMNVGRTTPVGQYSPQGDSPFGCADMAGNVWEWCLTRWQDSYRRYDDSVLSEPEGEAARVGRGGSFNRGGWGVRCAVRYWDYPYLRVEYGGFRLAASPSL